MLRMYSNLAKSLAFPLTSRGSSKPRCFKQLYALRTQSLPIGTLTKPTKPSLNPINVHFTTRSHGFGHKYHKIFNCVRPTTRLTGFQRKSEEMGDMAIARARSLAGGVKVKKAVLGCSVLRSRSFSSSHSERVGERSRVVGTGKSFPWLSTSKVKEAKRSAKPASSKSYRSSWEESMEKLGKVISGPSWDKSANRLEEGTVLESGSSSWEESGKRLENGAVRKTTSTWEDSAETVSGKGNNYLVRNKESRIRMVGALKNRKSGNGYGERNSSGGEEAEEKGLEVVDDPRWDKIKDKVGGMVGMKGRAEKPEFQRWNNRENWGRKIWKEATESTLPKMVGEVVYGVGPVLAALSAGRREFYALYVQEGLDLSGNNRKKKDKKSFEKVLRMAKKIGLSTKEVSKHDLNMVADNRPHQGLVLDTSPLEMVKINQLDTVLPEEGKGSLWVALDEVTDPQNLGAIIRSAYYFGASGIVLCAKNSAPLSGVVSKASAGSLELMELRYCKNMMQFLVSSAENGWRVLGGSVSSKAVPLNEILPGKQTIIVLGSEGTGLRPLVERSCTQLVRIPGNIPVDVTVGGADGDEAENTNLECLSQEFRSFLAVESLNVSVAAGVLLHHLIGNNSNDNCLIADEAAGGDTSAVN